jgi:hypothetical protein
MIKSDIIETVGTQIERKIGGEWKHEVVILGMSSNHLNFEIDGKEYVFVLHEVKDGQHFTDFLKEG